MILYQHFAGCVPYYRQSIQQNPLIAVRCSDSGEREREETLTLTTLILIDTPNFYRLSRLVREEKIGKVIIHLPKKREDIQIDLDLVGAVVNRIGVWLCLSQV